MPITGKILATKIVRMRSSMLLVAILAPVLGLAVVWPSEIASGQEDEFDGLRIVNILEEPRHRIVHNDGDLWLLDVQINPGDTTLPHTHDSAILYTFISNGEGPLYGRVSSNTDYVTTSYTHRVSNEGPGLFRIIALANYGAGKAEEGADLPTGLTREPTLENPWFRSYRIELDPGASTALKTHRNPGVIIQVSEGTVHISREDGITAELAAMGDWAWRRAGSPYQMHNAGEGPVTVVINEGRR